eukprot:m.16858 g.16858  ORF g.16858 m.16858 type:complete len:70 (-) comp6991_c0_seq2:881-1090(-)
MGDFHLEISMFYKLVGAGEPSLSAGSTILIFPCFGFAFVDLFTGSTLLATLAGRIKAQIQMFQPQRPFT